MGRSPDQGVVLAHPFVSRRHAAIIFEDSRYYVTDQGSRRTFVDGQKVTRHALSDHDVIHFDALEQIPAVLLGTTLQLTSVERAAGFLRNDQGEPDAARAKRRFHRVDSS